MRQDAENRARSRRPAHSAAVSVLVTALAAVLIATAAGCSQKSAPRKKPDHKARLRELVKILKSEPGTEAAHKAAMAAAEDDHPLVRARAADALGELGMDPGRSVERLKAMLSDEDAAVRATAALSLRDFGKASESALEALLALLAASEPVNVRSAAALAAGSALDPEKAAPEAQKKAKDALLALLDDPEEQLKNSAIAALGELMALEALPRLLSMLMNDENYFLRESCAAAAGRMGKGNAAAVKVLADLAVKPAESDEERSLRIAAAKALWKADPENALTVPVLVEALSKPEWGLGRSAREGLAEAGEKAAPFVIPLLGDEREEIRALAAATLGHIGPGAFCAVPELQRIASSDESELARKHAREALFKITREQKDE